MRKILMALSTVFVMCACNGGSAATWHVDASVKEFRDGTSWETAFEKIQEGIDAAAGGDMVLVAQGTYVENVLVRKRITLEAGEGGETVLDAGGNGAALAILDADGLAIRDLTTTNAGGEAFGGIYCANSTVIIEHCKVKGNSGTYGGGAFLVESSVTLKECRIEGNTAEENGGGIYVWRSRVLIDDCIITGNSAEEGGGLFCWYAAPRIVRTVIAKNSAAIGGGIACDGSIPIIVNCTIADNSATQGETGGLHCIKPSPTLSAPRIMNSIIWGNGKAVSGAPRFKIEYCDTDDPSHAGASGNISQAPQFVNASQGDYSLASGSPCIDAGNPDPAYNDEDGTRCDMGAFGGTSYVREQAVITHVIAELSQDILIYWLPASFDDFVLQAKRMLKEPWSGSTPLDAEQPYMETGVLFEERARFYRILRVE